MNRWFLGVLASVLLATTAAAQPVKIGIYPSNDPAKLSRVMAMLANYLAEKTGDDVQAIVTRDYDELVDRLKDQSIGIAWINTLNYLRITRAVPTVRYLATYKEHNDATGTVQPFYQSYVVAMRSSGFGELADIKGARFGFTDIGSTSGYAYPFLLLQKAGIDPNAYFAKVFFLKKHDRVIEALLQGSIDAGAVSDGTYFTALRNHGNRFAILAKSEPIPLDAIVAVESFPPDRAAVYRDALVAMPSDHAFCTAMLEVLGWHAAGFDVRDDAFYDSAREALGQ